MVMKPSHNFVIPMWLNSTPLFKSATYEAVTYYVRTPNWRLELRWCSFSRAYPLSSVTGYVSIHHCPSQPNNPQVPSRALQIVCPIRVKRTKNNLEETFGDDDSGWKLKCSFFLPSKVKRKDEKIEEDLKIEVLISEAHHINNDKIIDRMHCLLTSYIFNFIKYLLTHFWHQ